MAKKIYSPTIVDKCPCCGRNTKHMVFDLVNGIYKCLICNDVHALKK